MSDTETSTPEEAAGPNLSLLASESFGNNFHGEVTPDPQPEEVTEELQAEEAPVTEEAAEETTELETEERLEVSNPHALDTEVPISTLQELIEANEYDPEWLNSLQAEVKIDGVAGKASISDLINSYQIQEAAEKRLNEVKEKASEQNQLLANKQEQVDQSLQVAANLIQKVESKLTSDFEKINWDELEKNDPAEWSAQKVKLSERMNELSFMKQQAITEYQQNAQRLQAESSQASQDRLVAEQEALLEKLPEWKDAEVAKTEQAAVGEYLAKQGHTPEEISQASDHRMILMARKAMLYDRAQTAEPAKKRLVKVPKTLKPGTVKTQAEINQSRLETATKNLANKGSTIDDALEVLRMKRGNT